jgi:hypothetical protein
MPLGAFTSNWCIYPSYSEQVKDHLFTSLAEFGEGLVQDCYDKAYETITPTQQNAATVIAKSTRVQQDEQTVFMLCAVTIASGSFKPSQITIYVGPLHFIIEKAERITQQLTQDLDKEGIEATIIEHQWKPPPP